MIYASWRPYAVQSNYAATHAGGKLVERVGEEGRVGACRAGAGQPDSSVVRPTRRKRPRAGVFLHAPTATPPGFLPRPQRSIGSTPIPADPIRSEPSVSSSRRGAACPNALNARHEQPGPPGHLLFGADSGGRKGKGAGIGGPANAKRKSDTRKSERLPGATYSIAESRALVPACLPAALLLLLLPPPSGGAVLADGFDS